MRLLALVALSRSLSSLFMGPKKSGKRVTLPVETPTPALLQQLQGADVTTSRPVSRASSISVDVGATQLPGGVVLSRAGSNASSTTDDGRPAAAGKKRSPQLRGAMPTRRGAMPPPDVVVPATPAEPIFVPATPPRVSGAEPGPAKPEALQRLRHEVPASILETYYKLTHAGVPEHLRRVAAVITFYAATTSPLA